jgi:hypothetical protein
MRQIALILTICPAIAAGQTIESLQRASALGDIIGSEALCNLTLDQAGIEAWIAANVPADDMTFASHLQAVVGLAEYQQKDMSASAKTAHCAAVRQSAKAAGLIK